MIMLLARSLRIVLCVVILVMLLPSGSAQALTATFSNPAPITIPGSAWGGPADPFPSTITVGGLPGTITKVTVTFYNLSHTFAADLDILLVGPGGQASVLMSDAGAGSRFMNATLTFDDDAGASISIAQVIPSGTYRPTQIDHGIDIYPAPAPGGTYGSALALFYGSNPNGTWRLYVVDDQNNDSGSIAGGWSLSITTTDPPAVAPPWDPGDGRLNPEQAAPLAIYCDADSIYAYIPDYLEFDFPRDQIGPAPAAPAVPARTLLAEYPDGTRLYRLATGQYQLVGTVDGQEQTATLGTAPSHTLLTEGVTGARLYRLATGELQVNFMHGSEEYVFTWDACPATRAITRVYNSATRALLAEYSRTY